jgi:small membrane protein
MVIQILLSLGLTLALIYAFLQQTTTRLLRIALALVILLGLYFVWFPDETNTLAHLVGVGRGTDLLLYCWIVISILLILVLHLRMNRLADRMTDLVRGVALERAEAPPAPERDPRDAS